MYVLANPTTLWISIGFSRGTFSLRYMYIYMEVMEERITICKYTTQSFIF